MYESAECTIAIYAAKKPSLAMSAALSLVKAKQADRIKGFAQQDQVNQFNRLAAKANQRLLKKIYLLID